MGQVSLTTEDFLLNASSGVAGRLGTWSNPHGTEVVEDKGIVRAVISFGEINKSLRLLEVEKRYHETSLASLAIETFGILLEGFYPIRLFLMIYLCFHHKFSLVEL